MIKYLLFVLCLFSFDVIAKDDSLHELMKSCAPDVHPQTMGAIINHESKGNYLIIGDNGNFNLPKKNRIHRSFYPSTTEEAINISNALIAQGHVIDIGLGQLNNRNLSKLNMTVKDAFDPCKNLQGSSKVLIEFFQRAQKKYGSDRIALFSAISAYNTGSFVNGFKNGYVSKVVTAGVYKVSQLNIGSEKQRQKNVVSSISYVRNSSNQKTKISLAEVKNAPGQVSNWVN